MQFNAWGFARAWNSVALAQGDDKGRPALYRSTLIEMYPNGVRLVSTDSYILLKGWVPSADFPGDREPGQDQLPEDTALCSDKDRRVVALMKYAQEKTKQDGDDTEVRLTMSLGTMRPGDQGTLDGMTQTTVTFHFDHLYDERIETPIHDGAFPQWRPLWFSHRWQQTGTVSFGADGILRLGKLSALWDRATIRFELGGQLGVSKVHIIAPGVTVAGLAMPMRDAKADGSEGIDTTPVPASVEGIDHEFGDAFDTFLAEVLRDETAGDDEVLDAARRSQLIRAANVVLAEQAVDLETLSLSLQVTLERAGEILVDLLKEGIVVRVSEDPDDPKYDLAEDAAEIVADMVNDDMPPDPGDPTDPEPV